MRGVLVTAFGETPAVVDLPDPACDDDAVVLNVDATGLCRSDWHGWMGHDPDIQLPHVPGHELAGTIVEVGRAVTGWSRGDRVTVPFVLACGACESCSAGQGSTCPNQLQPGFSNWGSFATHVAIPRAAFNLVRIPDGWRSPPRPRSAVATRPRTVPSLGSAAWSKVSGSSYSVPAA